jgi:hypothetical protein
MGWWCPAPISQWEAQLSFAPYYFRFKIKLKPLPQISKPTKAQKAHSKFKTRLRNSKLHFEIQNSTSKLKIRFWNSKLHFEIQNSTSKFKTPLSKFKTRFRNSKLNSRNSKLDSRNSKLDFEIQNSISKFKTRFRNSKLDFEIQNSTSKFKTRLRNSKLGWPMKNILMKWESFHIQGRYIFLAVWKVTESTDYIRPIRSLQAYFYLLSRAVGRSFCYHTSIVCESQRAIHGHNQGRVDYVHVSLKENTLRNGF